MSPVSPVDPTGLPPVVRRGRRDRPVQHLPSVAVRAAIVAGVALVLFAIVFFRLWFLQVLSYDTFVARANDNRLRTVKIVAPRGAIVDRRGEVLVENRPGLAVGVRPMDVPAGRLGEVAQRLGKLLGVPPRRIVAKVRSQQYLPYELVVVKEDVPRAVVARLLEHRPDLPGVEVRKNYLRAYPHGSLAAHVLGHVGEISAEQLKQRRFKGYSPGDVVGKGGLEWTYDRWLRGRDGVAKVQVDALGRPKQGGEVPGGRLPEAGDTLVTTLDARVQAAAEEALRRGLALAHASGNWGANGGAAVVLDARDGGVLAMASYPTFDPAVWVGGISEKDFRALTAPGANYPLLNRAIQEAKAVGSTFKVVDAVAGLEEGVISPSTTFYCNGSYKVPVATDNRVFHCWSAGHGTLDLTRAIVESCDVYFYNVGYRFYLRAGTPLADWAVRLGLGRPTGIDIPGEVAGRVPTPAWKRSYFKAEVDKVWTPGDSLNLAVGQGYVEATPLQLAVLYAAIANGGTVVRPHLGLRIVDAQGEVVQDLVPPRGRRVEMSRATLDVVRRALRLAASAPGGTSAPVFAGYPVAVAGKTGTAEVWDGGRYVDYAWYASYAPADDPRYVVVVMIEKGGHGGSVAAPAARVIYDALFHVKAGAFSGHVVGD